MASDRRVTCVQCDRCQRMAEQWPLITGRGRNLLHSRDDKPWCIDCINASGRWMEIAPDSLPRCSVTSEV